MDHCKKCLISKNVPGVSLDASGLCNFCKTETVSLLQETFKIRKKYEEDLKEAADQLRSKKHKYHCVVALSGGKDSAYLAWLLSKKYKLNVLGVTVDTGYLGDQANQNITSLTKSLGIDHVFIKDQNLFDTVYKYSFSNKFFSREEGLACTMCCMLIPNVIMVYAMANDIPWIALGHFRLKDPRLFLDTEKFILSKKKFDSTLFDLLTDKKNICTVQNISSTKRKWPLFLNPLNTLTDYNAKKIYDELEANTGIKKENFYSEKTLCLVAIATTYVYKKAKGYNPYHKHVSKQIREGVVDKDSSVKQGLTDAIDQPENKKLVAKTLKSIMSKS